MFIEVNPSEFEKIDQSKYPELFPDRAVYENPDRLYKHKNYYIGFREMAGIMYADILNMGEALVEVDGLFNTVGGRSNHIQQTVKIM